MKFRIIDELMFFDEENEAPCEEAVLEEVEFEQGKEKAWVIEVSSLEELTKLLDKFKSNILIQQREVNKCITYPYEIVITDTEID